MYVYLLKNFCFKQIQVSPQRSPYQQELFLTTMYKIITLSSLWHSLIPSACFTLVHNPYQLTLHIHIYLLMLFCL